MTDLSELRFFTTPEHECSYLDDKLSTTLFADPAAIIGTDLYSALSAVGFRRSGQHIYRPHCHDCAACIPARVPANLFKRNKKQNRVWRKNKDMVVNIVSPANNDEYFALYEKYIAIRHPDGDMYPADRAQFESFLVTGRPEAIFIEFRSADRLIGICVADLLNEGISAIYTFFDPDDSRRSPGTYAVLWLIEKAIELNKQHVYLGYWIRDCQKMNYKTDYRPIEMYYRDEWQLVS